jgi:DNA-binding transcriptional LysR family regulator
MVFALNSLDMRQLVRRLRIRHFELLSHLALDPTLRSAAAKMALTQPAVTKLLQDIEEVFQTILFQRGSTGLIATPVGLYLMDQATLVINRLSSVADNTQQITRGRCPSIRIGTYSVLTRVPKAIAALRQEFPEVSVLIREATIRTLLEELAAGQLDAVVGTVPPDLLASSQLSGMSVKPVSHDKLCVVASPSHPLSHRRQLSWSDLHDCSWLLPPKESLLRRAFTGKYLELGLTPPHPMVELLSPVLTTELLSRDSGLIGLLRHEHAVEETRKKVLKQLRTTDQVSLPSLSFISLLSSQSGSEVLEKFRFLLTKEN